MSGKEAYRTFIKNKIKERMMLFKKNPYRRSIRRLKRVKEILEGYEVILKKTGSIDTARLESDIKHAIATIDYQKVKPYIITMWRNDVCKEVCLEYAKAYRCVEFHEILGII